MPFCFDPYPIVAFRRPLPVQHATPEPRARDEMEGPTLAVQKIGGDARASDWPAGGGEMGRLVRPMDWSKTKLGPIECWPSSLKTMLGVMLGSRFPMLLWWGP